MESTESFINSLVLFSQLSTVGHIMNAHLEKLQTSFSSKRVKKGIREGFFYTGTQCYLS